MKYVPRVARVSDVSVLLFSPFPPEKAARDEEEGCRMKARNVTRGCRLRRTTSPRLVDQSRSLFLLGPLLSKSNARLRASRIFIATRVDASTRVTSPETLLNYSVSSLNESITPVTHFSSSYQLNSWLSSPVRFYIRSVLLKISSEANKVTR